MISNENDHSNIRPAVVRSGKQQQGRPQPPSVRIKSMTTNHHPKKVRNFLTSALRSIRIKPNCNDQTHSMSRSDQKDLLLKQQPQKTTTQKQLRRSRQGRRKRVRFNMAKNEVHSVSYLHGPYGKLNVPKVDLWWIPREQQETLSREENLIIFDEDARLFLSQVHKLSAQVASKIQDIFPEGGIPVQQEQQQQQVLDDCDILEGHANPAVVNRLLQSDMMSRYRGLQSKLTAGIQEQEQYERMLGFLMQQDALSKALPRRKRMEELRVFSEKQSFEARTVARQWGRIDALAAAMEE